MQNKRIYILKILRQKNFFSIHECFLGHCCSQSANNPDCNSWAPLLPLHPSAAAFAVVEMPDGQRLRVWYWIYSQLIKSFISMPDNNIHSPFRIDFKTNVSGFSFCSFFTTFAQPTYLINHLRSAHSFCTQPVIVISKFLKSYSKAKCRPQLIPISHMLKLWQMLRTVLFQHKLDYMSSNLKRRYICKVSFYILNFRS